MLDFMRIYGKGMRFFFGEAIGRLPEHPAKLEFPAAKPSRSS